MLADADEAEDRSLFEIFICFFCEREYNGKPELQKHQVECNSRPRDMHYIGSPSRGNSKRLSRKACYSIKRPESSPKPTKPSFVEFLGLVPIAKAEKLKHQQNKDKEIDCEVIEIEDESIPKTPTTPRTPKSLISQLSRDVSPPAVVRRLDTSESSVEKKDNVEDGGSDCGKSDNGEEDMLNCRKIHSLLAIDISSALGQRIKKHIPDVEKELIVVKNRSERAVYEEYCHTPVKNDFQSRLRHRDNSFPVTFRPRRRPTKFCHEYSFTKRQRKERYMVMQTGLNERSRLLKKSLEKCSVELQRLTKKEIKERTRRRPALSTWTPQFLQGQRVLMSPEQLQQVLRIQGGNASHRTPVQFIDLSQFDSDDINEIQQQRTAIYNRLLTDSVLHGSRPTTGFSGELTPPSTPDPSSPLEQLMRSQRQQSLKNSPYFTPNKIHPVMSHVMTGSSHRAATPSNGFRPGSEVVDCDVISISSSDDEGYSPPASLNSRKRKRSNDDTVSQRRQVEASKPPPSALLFRCHMCHVEITCKQNAAQTIKAHFVNIHGVSNIDLVEHNDDKGQKVVSIVEVSVPKLNPATPPDLAQPTLLESAATSRPNLSQTAFQEKKSQTQFTADANKANRRLFGNQRHILRSKGQIQQHRKRNIVGAKTNSDEDIICLD